MPNFVITLKPGETVILPADTRLVTYTQEGDAQLSSSCNTLPPFQQKLCYFTELPANSESNNQMFGNPRLVKLVLGGNEYIFGDGLNYRAGIAHIVTEFAKVVPSSVCRVYGETIHDDGAGRYRHQIFFQILPSLVADAEFHILSNPNGNIYMWAHLTQAQTCDPQYPSPENTGGSSS